MKRMIVAAAVTVVLSSGCSSAAFRASAWAGFGSAEYTRRTDGENPRRNAFMDECSKSKYRMACWDEWKVARADGRYPDSATKP